MRNTDSFKWQRILIIYRFFLHKKGKPQAVKDVKNLLDSEDIAVNIRDVQRDLADMRDIGVLESIGANQNLRYKLPNEQAVDFYGELNESDMFSFLLMSRILFWMFGESIDIESLEKAISGSSQKTHKLYGKDLYKDLAARMSGILEYVGEQSARNGKPSYFNLFIKSLLGQRKLEVEYGGAADETPKKRILEPWALIVYKSSLYLLCNDKNKLKCFKLSRFTYVKILSETFEKKYDVLKKELDRMKYDGTIWDAKKEQGKRTRFH